MANNWAEWDAARSRLGSRVGGRLTSKPGLAALDKRGVRLEPRIGYTRVHVNGQHLGSVHHPFGSRRTFQVESATHRMDQFGPHADREMLGEVSSHDQAVGMLLRAHGHEPPALRSADRVASTVAGPADRSTVSRAYSGRQAAPGRDMSGYARTADSTRTRIRMNAAKTDPVTGEKIVRPARSADRLAARMDSNAPTTAPRLKQMYGGLMQIHHAPGGQKKDIDKHVDNLAALPEHHHRMLVEHFGSSPSPDQAGIRISSGRAIDHPGTVTKELHDRGARISGDRPNEETGGLYYHRQRQLQLPEDKYSGSVSTAAHEAGHALDDALGQHLSGREVAASSLPHFQQVYGEVVHMHDDSKTQMNPYYLGESAGQNGSGAQEMWAEGYAAWVKAQRRYRTPDERAMFIGHALGAHPDQKLRVGKVLANYFDIQSDKIRQAVRQ